MRPARETTRNREGAYFVSTQIAGRRPLFRHERWARLMMATLAHYAEKDFTLRAYVIMPDHLHLLLTPSESLEKSIQLIKGGFSFRAKREMEWRGDIWQAGFTDHSIRDQEDWKRHIEYIRTNPIEARLVEDSALYEFMGFPNIAFPQGLKPLDVGASNVRAKARTLHSRGSVDAAGAVSQGLKPLDVGAFNVRAEARTLHTDELDRAAIQHTARARHF